MTLSRLIQSICECCSEIANSVQARYVFFLFFCKCRFVLFVFTLVCLPRRLVSGDKCALKDAVKALIKFSRFWVLYVKRKFVLQV